MIEDVLENKHFNIRYEEAAQTIHFEGQVRLLKSREIHELKSLLQGTLGSRSSLIHWDFSKLDYMDSTATHLLYNTLASLRGKETLAVRITGCDSCRAQQKLLPNLKRFFPAAELHYLH